MYAGVAGLRNHQIRMDVLSNNISNVNTYGYKAARATFADMFSQTLSSGSSVNQAGTVGGINPKQIGLGVMNNSIDVIHTAGAFQGTDRTLDLTIIDEGFFTVKDGDDFFYTRAGNLYLDEFGYLVDAGGRYLLGIMIMTKDEFVEELMDAAVHARIGEDEALLDGKEWDDIMTLFAEDEVYKAVYGTREEGELNSEVTENFGRIAIPTYFRNITIDERGIVKGINEEGVLVEVAVLTTATFQNPGGLFKIGDNLYIESSNSGTPAYLLPGLGANGALKPGGLEMSNVDLANEMTSMIVTQRGYQANSRVITVSDTLLEELINLKR
jgi:flagellar hook protein FlgE